MLTGDGAFHQRDNAQAVVDEDHQVIVATDVNTKPTARPTRSMTEQTAANTGQAPGQMLADARDCSADNLERADEFSDQHGTEFYVATGRSRPDEPPPVAARGRILKSATSKQRMARTLTTKKGRAIYARRKAIANRLRQMSTLQMPNTVARLDQLVEWLLSPPATTYANFTASSFHASPPSRRPDQRPDPCHPPGPAKPRSAR